MNIYQSLLENIKLLPVIDTHEHLPPENRAAEEAYDFFDLLVPYVCDNLVAAGISEADWNVIQDKHEDFEQRWNLFEPWIPVIRHTTYFRALLRTLTDVFHEPVLDEKSAPRITEQISKRNRPGIYSTICSSLRIENILTFIDYDDVSGYHDSPLQPVPTVSQITLENAGAVSKLEKETEVPIASLRTLEQALEKLFESYGRAGVRAVKFGSGYRRRLDYGTPDRQAAESVLERAMHTAGAGDLRVIGAAVPALRTEELLPLDDYLAHLMAELAAQYQMPAVFHTGIHAWNRNHPDRARTAELAGFIEAHPRTTFVLLHSGIPFIDEAVLLAAYYPNVHLNMAWMHIIDRRKSVEAVRRYLEMLPLNKISAFGGDYMFAENIYGHLQFAFENLAEAFGQEKAAGRLTEKECIETARLWLYDNPKRLFSL